MIKQVIVILEVQQPDREEAVNASYEDRDVLQVHCYKFIDLKHKGRNNCE